MGYTHYYYVAPEFEQDAFNRVVDDFAKMLDPLKHLGVNLAGGMGTGKPTITGKVIRFNGIEKCGHPKRSLGITWPSDNAMGVAKNTMLMEVRDLTKGNWFAGAQLEARSCGGHCSHEAFVLMRTFVRERLRNGKLWPEITEKHSKWKNEYGTYDREASNVVGKYFRFCKTAYKPYDLAVNVCLVIAKHHLKDDIVVSSDGTKNNWIEGQQFCQHFLGYGTDFYFN